MNNRISPFAIGVIAILATAACGISHPPSVTTHPSKTTPSAKTDKTSGAKPSSTPTTAPTHSPYVMDPQNGGLAAAVKYFEGDAADAAASSGHSEPVTQTAVANGVVVSVGFPWPITAAFVDLNAGTWVGLPLDFAVNTFERELSDGGLLFLSQGPVGDGTEMPFPYQELCSPQADGTFTCQHGPAYFPITAQSVRFGSKPGETLTGIMMTVDGLQFTFGNLQPADYLSIPSTTINYNGTDKTLTLHFSDTTLGDISGLSNLQSQYIDSVSAASKGHDTIVTLRLAATAAYYTGNIGTANSPAVLEMDFFSTPPARRWVP